MSMIPFHTVCPELAKQETRSMKLLSPVGRLPAGEYAFMEFYCNDLTCDCRRTFIQVIANGQPGILASINFGWEKAGFYRRKMPFDRNAPREITLGSLDPLNRQSEFAPDLLLMFQTTVADATNCSRLSQHYQIFRKTLGKPF